MKKQDLIDEIIFEKTRITKNLNKDEIKEVDIYFDNLLQEIGPAMEILDKFSSDKLLLRSVTNSFKKEIKEQKWLEKLSKIFYEHVDIETTQTES